jgi:hypothetical protein
MRAILAIVILLGTTLAVPAYAEDSGSGIAQEANAPATKYFDFEDDQVEGDLQRPDGELISSIPKAKQASLIEIRTDFIPEIMKSLEDL